MSNSDAYNCYDRAAHPFATLTAQHFGLKLHYLFLLLKTIQSMNMFLQQAYGISPSVYWSPNQDCFKGQCKGTAQHQSFGWWYLLFWLKCLYLKGLATPQYSLMSQMMFSLIALMCVDDIDLNLLNTERKSTSEVIDAGQRMIDAANRHIGFRRWSKVRRMLMDLARLLMDWRTMLSNSSYSIPTQCDFNCYPECFRVHMTKWN